MISYKIKVDEDAFKDIEEISDWYNRRVPNLGSRFRKGTKLQINTLKLNAHAHTLRYNNVRCMFMKKFPFLIHYRIDEKNQMVVVFAIIHTSRDPKIWEQRTKNI